MTQPDRTRATLANFAAQVPAMAGGNTPRAARVARELREVVIRWSHRDPRSVQRQLGPSEVGHICHRQVVGKMCGIDATNHVSDPWPSIIGRAVHKEFEKYFKQENTVNGVIRWVPETRVAADPQYPGTADLYDAWERVLIDHKVLGKTSMEKVKSPDGPPWHYVVQMLIYAQGYRNLGLPVDSVILAAWPRTAPTLDELYCWERPYVPARDDEILRQVFATTAWRRQEADRVLAGEKRIENVHRTPSESCFFCDQFRPQAAFDGGLGCPGHSERS